MVEGTSDVALLNIAAKLYRHSHGVELLGTELSIIAAGYGDEGGVDGINKRFHAIHQVANADRDANGKLSHRFIALYDNDTAGKRAIAAISSFDASIRRCAEVFLLQPVMPLKGGADHRAMQHRFERENSAFRGLDWEIEDLLSHDILRAFEAEYPAAVFRLYETAGRTHREFTTDGKRQLIDFVRDYATLDDVRELIKLLKALRDYCTYNRITFLFPRGLQSSAFLIVLQRRTQPHGSSAIDEPVRPRSRCSNVSLGR